MKRSRMLLVAATVTVALLVAAPTLPAMAQTSEDSNVFFPVRLGNGGTYSCASGPPFIVDEDDPSAGNCSFEQIGAPNELACDVPTSITFVHDRQRFVAEGSLCHE